MTHNVLFSTGFKKMFKHSPKFFRKHQDFLPLQLKFDINNRKRLHGGMVLDVKKVNCTDINIVGYSGKVKKGFHVIGKCWRDLHKNKELIENKVDLDFLIGVNDYSNFKEIENNPTFTYIAGVQVATFGKFLMEWKNSYYRKVIILFLLLLGKMRIVCKML